MNTSSVIGLFLAGCSSAEPTSASPDKHKCKPILVLKLNCTFKAGLSHQKCKLFLGRDIIKSWLITMRGFGGHSTNVLNLSRMFLLTHTVGSLPAPKAIKGDP